MTVGSSFNDVQDERKRRAVQDERKGRAVQDERKEGAVQDERMGKLPPTELEIARKRLPAVIDATGPA